VLNLLDYRRRVTNLYRDVRANPSPEAARKHFRHVRDDLFRVHIQSPLSREQKAAFAGLPYYDYDPAYRRTVRIDYGVEHTVHEVDLGEDGLLRYRREARVIVDLPEATTALNLYWLLGYGGGLFIPFRDATGGDTTYGGGRYLYDTIKGADLGASADEIVLDFNFAYNPSCAYNPRWVCPLPPPENHLPFAIHAGERYPENGYEPSG
jgi:hypothetical protein